LWLDFLHKILALDLFSVLVQPVPPALW